MPNYMEVQPGQWVYNATYNGCYQIKKVSEHRASYEGGSWFSRGGITFVGTYQECADYRADLKAMHDEQRRENNALFAAHRAAVQALRTEHLARQQKKIDATNNKQ